MELFLDPNCKYLAEGLKKGQLTKKDIVEGQH